MVVSKCVAIVALPRAPLARPRCVIAIIEEAHRLRLKAYVHAPGMRQAKEVLRAGADGLVHLSPTRRSMTSSSR